MLAELPGEHYAVLSGAGTSGPEKLDSPPICLPDDESEELLMRAPAYRVAAWCALEPRLARALQATSFPG